MQNIKSILEQAFMWMGDEHPIAGYDEENRVVQVKSSVSPEKVREIEDLVRQINPDWQAIRQPEEST